MTLKYRQDGRTKRQFKDDIKKTTAKERFLMNLFKREMKALGHDISFRSNGCDNSGNLVDEATCAADYKVRLDEEDHLLEIKNSPVGHKWTFKTHNLKSYVKQGASILIFWDTGNINKDTSKLKKTSTRFGIISNDDIKNILEMYLPYNEPLFGGKECVQISKEDFDLWLKPKKLQT